MSGLLPVDRHPSDPHVTGRRRVVADSTLENGYSVSSRSWPTRIIGRITHCLRRLRLHTRHIHSRAERLRFRRPDFQYAEEQHKIYLDTDRQLFVPRARTFGVDHLLFPSSPAVPSRAVPSQLFLLWTGDNPMSESRQRSVDRIREVAGHLDVHLVTPANLPQYIVEQHPLNPAYEHLTPVHRADYLRAYLMRHHGGVYTDIKPLIGSPAALLELLESSEDVWAAGAPEIGPDNLSSERRSLLGQQQRAHFDRIVQQGLMAHRPGTPLAVEWLDEVERRIRYFSDLLERYPARSVRGIGEEYPIPWYSLLAEVLSPLCLKYLPHIITTDAVEMELRGDYY